MSLNYQPKFLYLNSDLVDGKASNQNNIFAL